jgi:hypothetical protein
MERNYGVRKYTWEEKKYDDSRIVVVVGGVAGSFLVDGIAHLDAVERAKHIEALIELRKTEMLAGNPAPSKFEVLGRVTRVEAERPSPVAPPMVAEALLAWFTPKASCDAVLGDLQQLLETDSARLGENHAKRRYWMRVIRNVGPSLWHRIMGLSLVTFLINYGRSKLGL